MPNYKREPEPDKPRSLPEVAEEVGGVYYVKKDASDDLEKLRKEFFTVAALEKASEGLAQKVAEAPESIADPDEARAFVERYHTGWRVIEDKDVDAPYVFLIEEDPDYKGHSIVIPIDGGVIDSKGKEHPGYVVTKTIRSGTILLDDERLLQDDPELYQEVTEPDPTIYGFVTKFMANNPGIITRIPRVPKNPDALTDEQSEAIRPYLYEDAKTLALNVRYAKEEELGEG